jgi:hypothetical protein
MLSVSLLQEGDGDVHSFLQQLPTLVGVLIGAMATYAATSAAELARWRRAQSVRWDEKRANAYMEYAHSLKQVIYLALRLAVLRDSRSNDAMVLDADEVGELNEAEVQRTIKWEAVLLLGSNEAVIAARNWHNSVFRLERLAHGKPVDMPLAAVIEAISQARRNFYAAAKGDIGIDVGASADAYEWQLSKTTDLGLDDGDPTWYRSRRFSEGLPDYL